jgi:hypothetical protein
MTQVICFKAKCSPEEILMGDDQVLHRVSCDGARAFADAMHPYTSTRLKLTDRILGGHPPTWIIICAVVSR